MNCRAIEPLLLAERDGVLTTSQHASLDQHASTCASCRQLRVQLADALTALRSDTASVSVPDIDEEWSTLRARLKSGAGQPAKRHPLASVVWFGAPLAAAAAVAIAFFTGHPATPSSSDGVQVADTASAEFVEAGDADASTMVYVDKDSGWLVVWATNDAPVRTI